MKWLALVRKRPSCLRDIFRVSFNLPVFSANDIGHKQALSHTGDRRKVQQTAYLQYTGGVDRRCSGGRRADDPRSSVSFIGEFL